MALIRNIQFSLPCREDIHGMDSCRQEKHCKSCDRTIIDFRNKSGEELENVKKGNQTICGIFSEKQVARGYENYFQLAAATVLALGLSISDLHAQEETDPFKFPVSHDTLKENTSENILVGVVMAEDPTPEYPGGMKAMIRFFQENLAYPSDSVQGKVYISAIVDTSGRIQQVKIRKSLSPLADAEVMRVVKLMIFKPALLNGKPVKSSIALPVSFSMGKKD
jgi:TonB family protein